MMIYKQYLIITFSLIVTCIANSYSQDKWQLVNIYNDTTKNQIEQIICNDLKCIAMNDYKGYYAQILSSEDGGKNWKILIDYTTNNSVNKLKYPLSISYPDENHLFIAYSDTGIRIIDLETKKEDSVYFESPISKLVMHDSLFGVIKVKNFFYYTEDKWRSKKVLLIPTYPNFDPYKFRIWIHSKDSIDIYENWKTFEASWYEKVIQYRTTNRGESWRIDTIEHAHAGDVYYVDRLNGWMAGGGIAGKVLSDVILKTTDGGDSWDRIYDNMNNTPKFGLRKIIFRDIDNGIAIGRDSKILRTSDNGKNWNVSSLSDNFSDMYPIITTVSYTGNSILIGGYGGAIFRLEESTGIEESKKSGAVIYPNPARDQVFIRSAEIENYRIYDIYGNLRLSGIASDNRIKVNELENGNYYITLGSETLKFQISR